MAKCEIEPSARGLCGSLKGSSHFKKRKSRGQFVIEAVLLLSIGLMLLMGLKKWAEDSQIFANIFTKPWTKISGMIENGAWGDPTTTRLNHPHNPEKVATLQQQ